MLPLDPYFIIQILDAESQVWAILYLLIPFSIFMSKLCFHWRIGSWQHLWGEPSEVQVLDHTKVWRILFIQRLSWLCYPNPLSLHSLSSIRSICFSLLWQDRLSQTNNLCCLFSRTSQISAKRNKSSTAERSYWVCYFQKFKKVASLIYVGWESSIISCSLLSS